MNARLSSILQNLRQDHDGIWCANFENIAQAREIKLREQVARERYHDYLREISRHHSIEVMDHEVRRALAFIPPRGSQPIVMDVGGCWGWHWRNLAENRPDVQVIIVDFVKANLKHAINVLGGAVGKYVHLVHADATQLPFPDGSSDLYWSVQTLQHIPDFRLACREAHRVLLPGGIFINYSLNRAKLIEYCYRLLGKPYVVEGQTSHFYLARASSSQRQILEDIFSASVSTRYTEIFFHPDLRLMTGSARNPVGRVDAFLGCGHHLLSLIARQCSFHVRKHATVLAS